jgi:hypothetical protein
VDKYRRQCVWRDKDLQKKKQPLAAWELACRPKDQGGLGVLNLSVQNDCLLMKDLHQFYNKVDLLWVKMSWELYYSSSLPPARTREVSFWWRDFLKLLPRFKDISHCDFIQGNSILLWQDKWSGLPLKDTWPHLYSFCKEEGISIKQALLVPDASDLFFLPLSEEALLQFHIFQALLLDPEPAIDTDTWTVLGNVMTTKVSSIYSSLMDFGGTIPALKWIWQECCQQKHKIFFWSLVHNRLNTRAMFQRKNLFMNSYTCIICDHDELESRNHLFFLLSIC